MKVTGVSHEKPIIILKETFNFVSQGKLHCKKSMNK